MEDGFLIDPWTEKSFFPYKIRMGLTPLFFFLHVCSFLHGGRFLHRNLMRSGMLLVLDSYENKTYW